MNARVKKDYCWSTLTAFGGHIFSKSEYRRIPAGYEKDAQAHPGLEIQFGMKPKEPVEVIEPVEVVQDAPVVEKEKPFVKGGKAGRK